MREWLDQRLKDSTGDALGSGGDRERRCKYQELVPAKARDHVRWRKVLMQPVRDGLQQAVTLGVAEGVVDDLEAVEVNQDDCHTLLPLTRIQNRALHVPVEQVTARQPG